MGYRNYIASLSLEEYNQIKDLNKEELYKLKDEDLEDGYVGVYNIVPNKLYELGKYVDVFPEEYFSPFFTNEELQKHCTEGHDFYIVGKEFLANVIDSYSEKIRSLYKDMLDPFFTHEDKYHFNPSEFLNTIHTDYGEGLTRHYTFDFDKITPQEQTALFKIIEHVKSMGNEWGVKTFMDKMRPYRLEKGGEVTTSWKYEYVQFELVRIYKTFDWDNDVMVYYGY